MDELNDKKENAMHSKTPHKTSVYRVGHRVAIIYPNEKHLHLWHKFNNAIHEKDIIITEASKQE